MKFKISKGVQLNPLNWSDYWHPMTISIDKTRTGDIVEVTMQISMPTFKVSQFTYVGQSFDDYRYEIINQAESKLRSYIEAASKIFEASDEDW